MHYLTITEYNNLTDISRPTIYKRARNGLLDSIKTEDGLLIIKMEDSEYERVKSIPLTKRK